jgi:HAD superfamily hydrolase (TIGR01549 family)
VTGILVRRPAAVIFDMDGTLVDSSVVVPQAYVRVVGELGGRRYRPEDVIAAYGVGPPVALLSHLLERPVSSDEVDRYHRTLDAVAGGIVVYAGIAEALARMAGSVPIAVFSGADTAACVTVLRAAGLLEVFDAVVGSDEVPHPKPAPDGISEACRRVGVRAFDAAYVGDSPRDLEAARRSGALAVAAVWGHEYVPGAPADVVAANPADVLKLVA